MKKYIMFANSISGIGGAQLYILRKLLYLLENGYEPYLIVGNKNPIEHNELKQFNTLELPQLFYPPNLYNYKKRSKFTSKVKQFINYNNTDKVYIESHQTAPALWAEIFAQEINSINFIYALAPIGMKRKVYQEFFNKKLDNESLIGCSSSFIKNNFDNTIAKNNYFNIPFSKDEIVTLKDSKVNDNKFDLKILTMSRIDKTYIKASILELIKYASKNKDIKIKYNIYINITSGKEYNELKLIVDANKNNNLEINFHGPVYPLNNSLYHDQDLFIGMGTSILNAASMELASLVVDYRNNKYYGFFGEEHQLFGTSEEKASTDLSVYIDRLIENKIESRRLGKIGYLLFLREFENETVNSKFIKFMDNSMRKETKQIKIPIGIFDLRDLVDIILINIFGIKKSILLREKIINLFNRNKNHI